MAAPDVADPEGEDGSGSDGAEDGEDPGDGQTAEDEEVEVVETSIEETGTDPDGFFEGVDESVDSGDDVGESIFDGVDGGGSDSDEETPEARETRTSGVAENINNGAARLAVIGLDDEWESEDGESKKKDDLQEEFKETFEAFRLGHYGSTVIEEYLLVEAEDIHPVWGLVGAMLVCAAVVVFQRPDGDQIVERGKIKLGQVDLANLKPNN